MRICATHSPKERFNVFGPKPLPPPQPLRLPWEFREAFGNASQGGGFTTERKAETLVL